MLAEFGDAPRAMRITCYQIGDDLLDAARTSAHVISASSCCPRVLETLTLSRKRGGYHPGWELPVDDGVTADRPRWRGPNANKIGIFGRP